MLRTTNTSAQKRKNKRYSTRGPHCFHYSTVVYFHNLGRKHCLKKMLSMVTKDFHFLSPRLQMVNRLTKSAEMQVQVDDEYFNINVEGHQIRLKWENTLKDCYQV